MTSHRRLALLAIFVVAIGVRLAYLESNSNSNYWQSPWPAMAHNIIEHGHWFQDNDRAVVTLRRANGQLIHEFSVPGSANLRYADAHPLWRPEIVEPVGEAVVLAGLWEITGSEGFLPDQLLKIIIDALCVLLVYWIALQLFRRPRAALLAAALYALYPPIAYQTTPSYMDIWAVDLTIAILALQLQAARSPHRWRWLIACGLLVGVGTYFRPFLLVVSLALAVTLNLSAGWRAALVRGAACTAIALMLVLPWTIRNYNDFHRFIPLRSGFGQTLWEGLGQFHNTFGATFGGLATERLVAQERPALVVESPAWDSFLEHKAISAIEQHPLFFAEVLAHRTALATVLSYNPNWMHRGTASPVGYKGGPLAFAVDRPFDLLQDSLEPAVFLLAMLSVGLTWRRWSKGHVVLIVVVLSTIVPYLLSLIEPRYIIPAAVAYLIWIAVGIDLLAERVGRRLATFRARPAGRHAPARSSWLR
jgi:4-amino-4-deoxy-L-arabinose transferase-like glycosyltransferase